jgi:nucleotide-binding universal stress UspA family protein
LTGPESLLIAVHIVEGTQTNGGDSARDSSAADDDVGWGRAVADITRGGIKAITRVVNHAVASPAQAIADIARAAGADVIVIGTRGHSPVGSVLAGSVTQRILEIAPCPVLAVPPTAATHTISEPVEAQALHY